MVQDVVLLLQQLTESVAGKVAYSSLVTCRMQQQQHVTGKCAGI
jgi:hypothetical protein